MINTPHKWTFINHVNGNILESVVIDEEKLNLYDFCYQFPKHGPDCLFDKLRIKDINDEQSFPERIKMISSQIQMNALFKTGGEIKN